MHEFTTEALRALLRRAYDLGAANSSVSQSEAEYDAEREAELQQILADAGHEGA